MNKPITKIVYRFNDASIPPQYHRSYTITVTDDKAHITVDSYGEILADKTVNLPKGSVEKFIQYIDQFSVKEKEEKNKSICAGGTSKSLTLYSNQNVILDGMEYQCGGKLEGSLSGNVESLTIKIEELIPDLAEMLK